MPITFLLLTWGELGIPNGSNFTPDTMKQVRRVEFEKATDSLGIKREVFNFGDLQLTEKPFCQLVLEVLKVIRKIDPSVIFSFHPYEITPTFDHPDHNLAGKLALHVGAVSDVAHYHSEFQKTQERAEVFLRTTDRQRATHQLKLGKKSQGKRDEYAIANYPSQFPEESQSQWRQIFDRIGGRKKKKREYWMKVR